MTVITTLTLSNQKMNVSKTMIKKSRRNQYQSQPQSDLEHQHSEDTIMETRSALVSKLSLLSLSQLNQHRSKSSLLFQATSRSKEPGRYLNLLVTHSLMLMTTQSFVKSLHKSQDMRKKKKRTSPPLPKNSSKFTHLCLTCKKNSSLKWKRSWQTLLAQSALCLYLTKTTKRDPSTASPAAKTFSTLNA